jgi:hypothetical protein
MSVARRDWVLTGLLIAALIGYYLSWLANPAAALSANAFDLAEWVGLAPSQRGAAPLPMPASFFLRATLLLLVLLYGLRARAWRGAGRVALTALALILALTLLPPLGFFRGEWEDPNYRQLMGLSAVALIGLAAVMLVPRRLIGRRAEASIALLIAVCAVIGQVLALDVIRSLHITAPAGVGFGAVIVSTISYAALILWRT